MKIYQKLSDFKPVSKMVVTIGTFDGVHKGHQKILERLKEKAFEIGGETVVLTFWPHPRLIVSPNDDQLKLLNTIDEKTEILSKFSIDHLLILPFTREFSDLSADKYIEEILISGINTHTLVIGYDHRFGKNREGGIDYLIKQSFRYKIDIEEISRQEIDRLTISSTQIRKALESGDINTATDLLGRPYSFDGPVVKGRQLGRTIGFPTANVSVQKNYKLIPKNGVYAVQVILRKKEYYGVMNIGNRPTVDGIGRSQEVHIFDFDDDIYGENLQVNLLAFIREEAKFSSIEELKKQINLDCIKAKSYFEIYE